MMLESKSVSQLLETARFAPLTDAIGSELKSLFVGVDISAHPGKLDIGDILEMDIRSIPAIMIGWTKAKPVRSPAEHYSIEFDLTAYIAVKDYVDLTAKRSHPREDVGKAIGIQLVRILCDEDHYHWQLGGITRPSLEKPPELKPVFTSKAYVKGIAYYAVTWSQSLIDEGHSVATDYGQQFEILETGINSDDQDFPSSDEVMAMVGNQNDGGGDAE